MLSIRRFQRLARTASASASPLMPFSRLSRSLHSSRLVHQSAAPATVKVSVNGTEVEVPSGFTVLQACESAGEHVPRFCYHDRLSIAGNCRMCLVEVEKSPKPVASCAFPLMPNMKIKTDTPVVKKAREGVMEFLLANHPLDCPICDQGGECDLQDQSMYFGSDRSRFREMKRSVEDKNLGPLVKTVMTRCIHCTRCVRFTSEICGITTLGTTGRGNSMEVGTYVDQLLDSELSGNVIDLCPVGALTSKPYAFTSRPWELVRTESIDTMDAVGAAIRIDSRGPEVMRILPRLNEDVNEEWIGDKSRFAYDGLKRQRIDAPLVKQGDSFVPVSWSSALLSIRDRVSGLSGSQVLGVVGEQADAESIVALKDWLSSLGSESVVTTQPHIPRSSDRSSYLFGSGIASIEYADSVLLLNCNPRMEAAVLSSRLRKSVRQFGQKIYSVGPQMELNMPHTHLGDSLDALTALTASAAPAAKGSSAASDSQDDVDEAREAFRSSKQSMVIVGMGAFRDQSTADAVRAALQSLRVAFPSIAVNLLHTNASAVAALDLGVGAEQLPKAQSAKFVYLLGADNLDAVKPLIASDAFVVYSGSHGDVGASMADIVLPAPCYTEKNATYVNTEGRVQRTRAAVGRLAEAREDWQTIRALSELTGKPLPYNSLQQCRERLEQAAPSFKQLNTISSDANQQQQQQPTQQQKDQQARGCETQQSSRSATAASSSSLSVRLSGAVDNYFFTDPISRSSATMAKCSAQLTAARNSYKASQQQQPQQHKAIEADKAERQSYAYPH